MGKATYVPITPAVLGWAISESGYEVDEVARRLKVSPQTFAAWLTGDAKPKLTEFRKLSTMLKRQEATFLLPEPPPSSLPKVEFRHPIGSSREQLNQDELRWLRETRRLQRAAAWVEQELGVAPPSLPRWTLQADPEKAGAELRARLGVSAETQLSWESSSDAQKAWRRAIESSGVLAFFLSLGMESCRGFSLWDEWAPLIAVNTGWNYEARIYTMFHEYGHLVTRTSSACVESWRHALRQQGDEAERWCERFAAAVLMPWAEVEQLLGSETSWRPGRSIESLVDVKRIARRLKTSLRATTLRLITHELATWDLYKQIPPVADDKSGGGGGSGRVRSEIRGDQYGRRMTDLLVEAMHREVLSRDDVLTYLDIPDADLPA